MPFEQVWQNATLDAMTGQQLYFKCELLQKTGAFKYRVGQDNQEQCLSIISVGTRTISVMNCSAGTGHEILISSV